MHFKSLSHGLIALLGMGLVASGQPVDKPAGDVAKSPPVVKGPSPLEAVGTAETNEGILLSDGTELVRRDELPIGFASPHCKRRLVITFASGLVASAAWTFDMWLTHNPRYTLWRSEVHGSDNIKTADVTIPAINTLVRATDWWAGRAAFRMSGYVGNNELIVDLVAKVAADAASTWIMNMLQYPVATLDGMSLAVTGWSFENPDNDGN
ncbi:hypothetical protein E4U41_001603 [Claviceps citrina]|nr:hypothetical protein E4U41_001603 [Claviceps citrina]